MRAQLAEGGSVARAALQELYPAGFWLRLDTDGRRLVAVFVDSLGTPHSAESITFTDLTEDGWMPAGAKVSGSGGSL
jgi:hypothetical protein